VAKIPVDVRGLGIDLLSLSAHKFNGPKGAGALWIKRGTRLTAHMTGGKHERNRRAGTENVPAIVGLGVAARLGVEKLVPEGARLSELRNQVEEGILARVAGTAINGVRDPRVPNTTNISFDGVEAESLLIALDLEGIAVSTGSACSSGTLEPSHVLRAMGLAAHRTQNSIRVSLGAGNTAEEVEFFLSKLPPIVEKLRSLTRVPAGHLR
jgi:cysteine desulfurase